MNKKIIFYPNAIIQYISNNVGRKNVVKVIIEHPVICNFLYGNTWQRPHPNLLSTIILVLQCPGSTDNNVYALILYFRLSESFAINAIQLYNYFVTKHKK